LTSRQAVSKKTCCNGKPSASGSTNEDQQL
jgi:hypothetical protein